MPGSRVAAWVAGSLDRHRLIVLALFSGVFFYATAIRAAAKPFWHDEIFTVLLAELPSLAIFWSAIRDGADLAPPLNTLLTRAVRGLLGGGPVAMRLGPMISVWIMMLLVHAIVRRRANSTIALTAALFPIFTAAYRYSYEARPYGLMMMLFALALFAWSEAAAGRRRRVMLPLLAASLAAGVWTHYFAVLAYVPIVAGELVRAATRRTFDAGVAAAIASTALAVAPAFVLASAASDQTSTFWSQAGAAHVGQVYSFLFEPLGSARFALAAAAILLLAALGAMRPAAGGGESRAALPAYEIVAGASAAALPVLAVLAGLLVTGVFVPRYALPGVVGMSVALPLAVWRLTRRARVAELVLPMVFVASMAELLRPVVRVPHPVESRPALLASLRSPGPTAVSSGLTFLQLWYYAPAELRGRLVYVADREAARRLQQSDTIDRGLLALSRWSAVGVVPLEILLQGHRRFRVYAYGSGWLLQSLREEGALLEDIGGDGTARLYQVQMAPAARREQAVDDRRSVR